MLVFLDFDGVLQLPALGDYQPMELLPAFEATLREHPQFRVVISSSHRVGLSLDTLQRLFSSDVRARVVGATPELPTGRSNGGRQREIEAWLRAHPEHGAHWVALDDERQLFDADCPRLVLTHPMLGYDESAKSMLCRHAESAGRCEQAVSTGMNRAPAMDSAIVR